MPSPLDMPKVRNVPPASSRWTLTPHASKRAKELGYDESEVLLCAQEPSLSYETDHRKYGEGEWVCKRGDIAVVVRAADKVVLTVLLPTAKAWVHGRDRRAS